jgi:hypothetical protein
VSGRELRRVEGRSLKEIARLLDVSTSSVSRWVGDILLTKEQEDVLRDRNPALNRRLEGADARSARARRRVFQHEGRLLARQGDPMHAAGCMLYWAEGSKFRTSVQFSNSDWGMVAFFVEFLHAYYPLSNEAVRVDCNLFADHVLHQRAIERFWLKATHLPDSCLRKSTVNTYSKYSEKKRRNKLPYGTCRISVHRVAVVQSIYGSIQEYAGFERPEWLG